MTAIRRWAARNAKRPLERDYRRGPRPMRVAAALRAIDLRSSHQFEEEIRLRL